MLTLAAGMPRAGSGWHYNLIHDLLVAGGGSDAREIRRRFWLAPLLTEVNLNIRTLSPQRLLPVMLPARLGYSFAIKSHSAPTALAQRTIAAGRMQVSYIYRDPRAALLSALEYGQRARESGRVNVFSKLESFADGLAFMQQYLRIWEAWMGVPGIHSLRYEDLLANFEEEATRLAKHLGLDTANKAIVDAMAKHHPGKANKNSKGQHFQHGEAGRFTSVLSRKQLKWANTVLEKWLREMNLSID